jgi:hypothetical protein
LRLEVLVACNERLGQLALQQLRGLRRTCQRVHVRAAFDVQRRVTVRFKTTANSG